MNGGGTSTATLKKICPIVVPAVSTCACPLVTWTGRRRVRPAHISLSVQLLVASPYRPHILDVFGHALQP